jgi:hypothetical protein
MRLSVFGAGAFVCLAIGCSTGDKTSDALTVRGSVPQSTLLTDNAKAIAISPAGHVYTAYLNRSGDFTLQLPTGHAYRVLIANTLPSGRHEVVGRLTLANRSSGTSQWLGARSAGTINLGELHTGSADGLKIQCGCSSGGGSGGGSGGDDHGDDNGGSGGSGGSGDSNSQGDNNDDQGGGDYSCHQDDGEKGKMCSGGGESDLHAQNDPGSKCDDSDLDDDQDKNEDDGGSCSGKGSGGDDNDDDQGENNNNQGSNGRGGSGGSGSASGSGSSGAGTSGSDSSDSSNAGSSCGCQAQGNPCNCASDCANGQSCVAGHCSK